MYHLKKLLSNGIYVHVELGVIKSKNPDHRANVHLFIDGVGHVRGIMVYQKEKNGEKEWVLRLPSYKSADGKSETAYLQLDGQVAEAIVEAVEKTEAKDYSQFYTGPKTWSIWHVQPNAEVRKAIEEHVRKDVESVLEHDIMPDRDEGDR